MFFYPSSSSSKPSSSSSFDPSVRLRPNGTLSSTSTSTGVVGTHQTYHRDPVLVARRSRRRHDDDDVNPDASPFVGDERRRRRPIFFVGSSRVRIRFDVRLRQHHRARPLRRAAHPSISNVGVDDTDDDHPRSHFVVVVVAIVISPVVGVVHPQKHLETDFVSVDVVVVPRHRYRRRRPDDDDVCATTTVISTGADAIRRRRHLASYRVVTRRRMKDEFLENQ